MRQIMQSVAKNMDSMHVLKAVRVARTVVILICVCVFVCRSTLCSDKL